MTRGLKVREEVPSVVLSEMLGEAGISNVSLLNLGKVPDIYLLLGGVRMILETKEAGQRAALETQLQGRLEQNLCEVAIGIEYPRELVAGLFAPPSPKEVRKKLLTLTLNARGYAQGGSAPRLILDDIQTRVPELPELLARAAAEAMPDKDLETAIDKVRLAVQQFTENALSVADAQSAANNIREVLDLGE